MPRRCVKVSGGGSKHRVSGNQNDELGNLNLIKVPFLAETPCTCLLREADWY
jgi:hypothetical protein